MYNFNNYYENLKYIICIKNLDNLEIIDDKLKIKLDNSLNNYDTIDDINYYKKFLILNTFSQLILAIDKNYKLTIDNDITISRIELFYLLDEGITNIIKCSKDEDNIFIETLHQYDAILDVIYENNQKLTNKCYYSFFKLIDIFIQISKTNYYFISNYINTGYNSECLLDLNDSDTHDSDTHDSDTHDSDSDTHDSDSDTHDSDTHDSDSDNHDSDSDTQDSDTNEYDSNDYKNK